ncbi:MAG: Y-family DNA polymerase [Burkholderiales bacterium]
MEVFSRGSPDAELLVVSVGPKTHSRVFACNLRARALGIRPGLAAHALMPGLSARPRDPAAERRALERLAAWVGQFSPHVSLGAQEVLLEICGSLGLFGGLGGIFSRVRSGLQALGYHARLAAAPTPSGAALLARVSDGQQVIETHELRHKLACVPLSVLELQPTVLEGLRNLGVRTLGDCLALPRGGLALRFGQGLLDYFDRLLGILPDPQPLFVPPPHFKGELALPFEARKTESLLFAAKRLLLELNGFLVAKGGGTTRLVWRLSHHKHPATRFTIDLVSPNHEVKHLLMLLRHHLERLRFPAPVLALELAAQGIVSLAPCNPGLFGEEGGKARDRDQLVELLRARLGEKAVYGLRAVAEHRPEYTWQPCAPGEALNPPKFEPRPLWLLAEPQPLPATGDTPGPLTLEAGPERIEGGWWDGHDISRDYYVARDTLGARFWVFRERCGARRWFVHGLFG